MIVLDTTVLVYAIGSDHPLRGPSRSLLAAIGRGDVEATTTTDVVQELVHVYSRRRSRAAAAAHGRTHATLLSPLLAPTERELASGLRLFEQHERLDAFDAVLAATAIAHKADALVSADRAYAGIRRLRFVELGSPELERLLSA